MESGTHNPFEDEDISKIQISRLWGHYLKPQCYCADWNVSVKFDIDHLSLFHLRKESVKHLKY